MFQSRFKKKWRLARKSTSTFWPWTTPLWKSTPKRDASPSESWQSPKTDCTYLTCSVSPWSVLHVLYLVCHWTLNHFFSASLSFKPFGQLSPCHQFCGNWAQRNWCTKRCVGGLSLAPPGVQVIEKTHPHQLHAKWRMNTFEMSCPELARKLYPSLVVFAGGPIHVLSAHIHLKRKQRQQTSLESCEKSSAARSSRRRVQSRGGSVRSVGLPLDSSLHCSWAFRASWKSETFPRCPQRMRVQPGEPRKSINSRIFVLKLDSVHLTLPHPAWMWPPSPTTHKSGRRGE